MRKSISDWKRNSFPDTVVIWGGHGHTQVSKAHIRQMIFLYFPSRSPQMLVLFIEVCLLECRVTEEFWTSVWKLFWICQNKRDIVSAMQPQNTNSAEITGVWQKLRKARKLGVTRHSSREIKAPWKELNASGKLFPAICSFHFYFTNIGFCVWFLHTWICTFTIYLWFPTSKYFGKIDNVTLSH